MNARWLGAWLVVIAGSTTVARAESPPSEAVWSGVVEGCQVVPRVSSAADGRGLYRLFLPTGALTYNVTVTGLTGTETAAHIHGPAVRGQAGPVLFDLPLGSPKTGTITLSFEQSGQIQSGQYYVDVHTTAFPDGEVRGQIDSLGSACAPPIDAGVIDGPAGAIDAPAGAIDAGGADAGDGAAPDRCGGCASGGAAAGWPIALVALALIARRRARVTS